MYEIIKQTEFDIRTSSLIFQYANRGHYRARTIYSDEEDILTKGELFDTIGFVFTNEPDHPDTVYFMDENKLPNKLRKEDYEKLIKK